MSSNEEENVQKTPDKKAANAPFNGAEDGRPFTPENQPSGSAKSAGWQRKRLLKEIVGLVPGKGSGLEKEMEQAAKLLGITTDQVTLEDLMHVAVMVKAAKTGDVNAFRAITERNYGRPRQEDAPPPPVTKDEEEVRQKSKFDLGDGMVFEV